MQPDNEGLVAIEDNNMDVDINMEAQNETSEADSMSPASPEPPTGSGNEETKEVIISHSDVSEVEIQVDDPMRENAEGNRGGQPNKIKFSTLLATLQTKIKDGQRQPKECKFCNYRTNKTEKLIQHLFIHSGKKPYICSICSFRFTQAENLKTHMQSHIDEISFKCDVCESRFSIKDHLKRHLRKHNRKQMHNCNLCDFKTAKLGKLLKHMLSHTKRPREPHYKCRFCDFSSTEKPVIKVHMWNHIIKRIRPRGRTNRIGKLRDWKKPAIVTIQSGCKNQNGEEPFKCSVCGFGSADENDFKRHIFAHIRQTVLNCQFCDFRTMRQNCLRDHLVTEHGNSVTM